MKRFYIISEKYGLCATTDSEEHADYWALVVAMNTGRTAYIHDRLTELNNVQA